MKNMDNWDNEDRNRYYGLRKGDIVTYPGNPTLHEVVEYGFMDNNSVWIQPVSGGEPWQVVAEWCSIQTKVENR